MSNNVSLTLIDFMFNLKFFVHLFYNLAKSVNFGFKFDWYRSGRSIIYPPQMIYFIRIQQFNLILPLWTFPDWQPIWQALIHDPINFQLRFASEIS